MQLPEINARRLANRRPAGAPPASAGDVVRWLGAVRARHCAGATWALAQRLAEATNRDVDRVFDTGAIIPTHVMRPTWHFVAPEDPRWLLALTTPRVRVAIACSYRAFELDPETLARGHAALERALGDGQSLTRTGLARVSARTGITASGMRLAHLLMHAELEGLICSGPRRGKQFTDALLDERVAPVPPLDRDEALVRLAQRFVRSHGPATAHDFTWWLGLTVADAHAVFAMLGPGFAWEAFADRT